MYDMSYNPYAHLSKAVRGIDWMLGETVPAWSTILTGTRFGEGEL